jgi:hypothetical protein
MGVDSILVRLENIEQYNQVLKFVNKYDNQYDIIGLSFNKDNNEYYFLIQTTGPFFTRFLSSNINSKIMSANELPSEIINNHVKIKDLICFENEKECLKHYEKMQTCLD